jgi:hypothetical protein
MKILSSITLIFFDSSDIFDCMKLWNKILYTSVIPVVISEVINAYIKWIPLIYCNETASPESVAGAKFFIWLLCAS